AGDEWLSEKTYHRSKWRISLTLRPEVLGWIYLLLAGCCEIFYAAAIPRTDGFTRLWPGSVPAEGEMTP
ncbi:MAG: hypothetical protein E6850_26285, partial [Leclercia adecarboxylata]|nr:hypothetical protein [Leclercia adecarboxylata]